MRSLFSPLILILFVCLSAQRHFQVFATPGAPAAWKLFCSAEVRITLKRHLQFRLSQLASDFYLTDVTLHSHPDI